MIMIGRLVNSRLSDYGEQGKCIGTFVSENRKETNGTRVPREDYNACSFQVHVNPRRIARRTDFRTGRKSTNYLLTRAKVAK